MEPVVDPVANQGIEIYNKVNGSQLPIYWQRRLPPNATYLHVKDGIPKHMILPLPFDKVRQLAVLHEYSHYRQFIGTTPYNWVPDEFIKKPKMAYTNKAAYRRLVGDECWSWTYLLGLLSLKVWNFEPEHLGLVMNEWGFNRYVTDYAKPDADMRTRIRMILHDAESIVPGFLKLPSTQKLLSDVSS